MSRGYAKGKLRLGVAVILAVALGPRGLGEAVVDADAIASAEPVEYPVDDAPSGLVFVEAQRLEVVQITRGLRDRERVGMVDVPGQRIGIAEVIRGRVPQERHEVTRRRQARALRPRDSSPYT